MTRMGQEGQDGAAYPKAGVLRDGLRFALSPTNQN